MISLIASAALHTSSLQELPYAPKDLIFQSTEDLQKACNTFLSSADTDLDRFVVSSKNSNYSDAYQIWSDLLFRYFSFKLELGKTKSLSLNEPVKNSVAEEGQRLEKAFQQKLHSRADLLTTFLNNAKASQSLTPQQRLFTEQVLKEYQQTQEKEAKKIADALQNILSTASYATAEGVAKPLNAEKMQELKVLTANVLCFPGTLNWMYGGASPWKERIHKLVDVIRNTDAHIVCLQEVWDPEAMRTFVELLKNDYAFFVYNAGDPAGTLDVNKGGYSSGLFVASKIALDSVAFNRFPKSIPLGSNRGAILATCKVAKERIAFVTTHLQHQSGDNLEMRQARREQLALCHDYLQQATKTLSDRSWGFLAGDLNINAYSEDYKDSNIASLFSVPYVANLSNEKATCTNYFNDLVLTPKDERAKVPYSYELLDYCVRPALSNVSLIPTQSLVPLYDLKAPIQALSDHQALLTTWSLSQK